MELQTTHAARVNVVRAVSVDSIVSPTFYPALFDGLLQGENSHYQQWKTSQLPWQLRLVGGPGSGKTSFAALALQDLHDLAKGNPTTITVLSAFLSASFGVTGDSTSLEAAFLTEIDNQLGTLEQIKRRARGRTQAKKHSRDWTEMTLTKRKKDSGAGGQEIQITITEVEHEIEHENNAAQPEEEEEEESDIRLHSEIHRLYLRIKSKLAAATRYSSTAKVYLLVDDLDAAWARKPEDYLVLEDILAWLDGLGVRILAMSRTYYRKNKLSGECDAELDDGTDYHHDFCLDDPNNTRLVAWWDCVACVKEIQSGDVDVDNVDSDDGYVLCEGCRRKGHRCTRPGHASSPLVYNKRIHYQDMDNFLSHNLHHLINHLLQCEHGPFLSPSSWTKGSPDSESCYMYPPLSSLGQQLVKSSPELSTGSRLEKDRLGNLVYGQCGRHLLNALCRIESILHTDSLPGDAKGDFDDRFEAALDLETSDRLPDTLVATFDELISRYIQTPLLTRTRMIDSEDKEQEPKVRAAIALHLICYLAKEGGYKYKTWVPISKLKKALLEEDQICGHGFADVLARVRRHSLSRSSRRGESPQERLKDDAIIMSSNDDDTLEYMISTAGGLLTMGRERDARVAFFHDDFCLYVVEGYNSFLARALRTLDLLREGGGGGGGGGEGAVNNGGRCVL